ncbi:MAG: 16S rRNA (guanine(966)-N(2))-methyltransferase RsmD [bacterium]
MRVISGAYKGRILKTVPDLSVRPVTDRVKQTIFDMLANRIEMDGARVLDLFAGSGGLGIEALSRGASHATFVENDQDAAHFIEQNISMIGCEEEAILIETDALSFIKRCTETFDLVFADPPYKFEETADIPQMIFSRNMISPHGYLLIEHSKELRFDSTSLYSAGPEKRFGKTLVTFFRHQLPG